MSGDENFLGRWSRRKQDARRDADTPAEPAPAPEQASLPSADATRPRDTADAKSKPAAPAFDPASLPSIESITSATDIRAFLAPGVPQELTRAALRRAWAADPAIRDYIGLSEYSWDFNAPDSMFGFEPLRATDDVKKLLAEVFSNREPPGEQRTAQAEPESDEGPEGGNPDETPRSIAGVAADGAIDGRGGLLDASAQPAPAVSDVRRSENIASQRDDEPSAPTRSADRRRHGGALPKV